MALSVGTIEDALVAWVKGATALEHVKWERQKGTQPPPGTDYATLQLGAFSGLGASPSLTRAYDSARPNGQQLVTTGRTPGILSLRVQVFTTSTVGDVAAFPLLLKASGDLDRESVLDALERAGLGLAGRGPVQSIPALLSTRDQGRAALDVRFNVTDVVTDLGQWIETVTVNGQVE
jgi:hypothetical protein